MSHKRRDRFSSINPQGEVWHRLCFSLALTESPVLVFITVAACGSWVLLPVDLCVLLPVDLPVLVQVLQTLQNVPQHRGDAGLVQDARLVFAPRDDVLYHVQNGAWGITTRKRLRKEITMYL